MDFWIVFIFVFAIIHSLQLHYRAGKRIRALEEDLTDLEKSFNRYLETSLTAADTMRELVKVSQEHDRELMSIRSRLGRKHA